MFGISTPTSNIWTKFEEYKSKAKAKKAEMDKKAQEKLGDDPRYTEASNKVDKEIEKKLAAFLPRSGWNQNWIFFYYPADVNNSMHVSTIFKVSRIRLCSDYGERNAKSSNAVERTNFFIV